jgi:hypothetical protein
MLRYKELDQVLDAICHQAAARLLFLTRRIPAFRSGSEYL